MSYEEKEKLIQLLSDFLTMTAVFLPDDVEEALRSLADEETIEDARTMYGCILDNIDLAGKLHRPLCQDTGVLQFFVEAGTAFPHLALLQEAMVEATKRATLKTPLRPNVVEPLGEHNTGDNTGYDAPNIHWDLIPKDTSCRIRTYMAGGGCSLPGRSKVLMPLEGVKGIKDFVYETVLSWGVNACPPLCIGVGLSTCAVTAAELSKKALLRPLNTHSPDPKVRALEEEMERDLNALGIAPLGFGGSKSVLGVNIEAAGHHPATLGIGLSTGCWATRRGELLLYDDLSCEILSHRNREERAAV